MRIPVPSSRDLLLATAPMKMNIHRTDLVVCSQRVRRVVLILSGLTPQDRLVVLNLRMPLRPSHRQEIEKKHAINIPLLVDISIVRDIRHMAFISILEQARQHTTIQRHTMSIKYGLL